MPICPHCSTIIHDQYNFCTGCERQVRCTECGNELGPAKTRCLTCGVALVANTAGGAPINEYSFEEEQTADSHRRRVELRFTDSAVEKATPFLSRLFPLSTQYAPAPDGVPQFVRSVPVSLPNAVAAELSAGSSHEAPQPAAPRRGDAKERAHRFFEVDGDELVPRVTDYKGGSKKEQQERFTLCYVWAYQHLFDRAVPSREHMNAAARRASLSDTNYRTYFSRVAKQFLMTIEGGYKLNASGISHVEAVLAEMEDCGTEGFAYWKGSSRSPRRVSRMSKGDQELAQRWADAEIDIGALDVRQLGVVDQVTFAIWAITRKLGAAQAVKPRIAYEYLTRRYKTVTVTPKAFADTLCRPGNSGRFRKNAAGEYYLTEEAEHRIEARMREESIPQAALEARPESRFVAPAKNPDALR